MRGRFAPSPTGRMHLGNARTALLAWLQIRAGGGQFLLRIEDLDRARTHPEHTDSLLRDLEWLGLTWDETPVVQSQRADAYEAALAKLRQAGRLYPCFCTRAEITRAAAAPHGAQDDGPRYPGTCAALTPTERATKERSRPPAWRFQPRPGITTFEDTLHGRQTQDVLEAVGDFVVRRNDGVASYQLAVVVDDAASRITHVVRADDLLASTARQVQLGEALGFAPPQWAHVPLLMGDDGKRLAKRDGVFALSELRGRGIPAERVVGYLAFLCGLGNGQPVSATELVPNFRWDRVEKEAPVASAADIEARLG